MRDNELQDTDELLRRLNMLRTDKDGNIAPLSVEKALLLKLVEKVKAMDERIAKLESAKGL